MPSIKEKGSLNPAVSKGPLFVLMCCNCRDFTYEDGFTPYMHVFVHHVPYFVQKYGSLGPFVMEEVEHLNYVNKMVFYGASNHGKTNCAVTDQVTLITYFNTVFICDRNLYLHFFTSSTHYCTGGILDFMGHISIIPNYFSDYEAFNKVFSCNMSEFESYKETVYYKD